MDEDRKIITLDEFLSQLSDGADFSQIELHDLELAQTTAHDLLFRHCTFVNVDMTDVDWEGLNCHSSKFVNCRFMDANLEKAVFENCDFFNPEASAGCNFMRANLRSGSFKKCNISGCVFEGADVFRISIQDSNAIGTKFFRAKFNGSAKLVKNVLRYADLRGR